MLAPMEEHLERTHEFFGARAGGWDAHFHDDGPRYEAAAADLLAPTCTTSSSTSGVAPAGPSRRCAAPRAPARRSSRST